jgi:hypothetical protein
MHVAGCHVTDARMAVLDVVSGKECLAIASGIVDAAKALREVGSVFDGLELRLRIGLSSNVYLFEAIIFFRL